MVSIRESRKSSNKRPLKRESDHYETPEKEKEKGEKLKSNKNHSRFLSSLASYS